MFLLGVYMSYSLVLPLMQKLVLQNHGGASR